MARLRPRTAAPPDVDMAALATMVGAEGQLEVVISRDINGGSAPQTDPEYIVTWSMAAEDVANGTLYQQLQVHTGGGFYLFKATKPGTAQAPVEWSQRLPGDPMPPPHVRAAREAKAAQQGQPGKAAAVQGQVPQAAPASVPPPWWPPPPWMAQQPQQPPPWLQPPVQWPAAFPFMGGAYGTHGHGPGHGQQQPPTDPLTRVIEVLADFKLKAAERPAVDPEVKAELDRLRAAQAQAERERAEDRERHRELLAQRDRELADARHEREAAQRQAESDRRFDALTAELKLLREGGGVAPKGPDPMVSAMMESLKLIASQAQEASKDAREAMTNAMKSALAKDQYPPWLIEMLKNNNAPDALRGMTAAYSELFAMSSKLTQAQIASLMEMQPDDKSGVGDVLRDAFGHLAVIGKSVLDNAAASRQPQQLGGARALPAGDAGGSGGAGGGASPTTTAPATAAPAPAPTTNGANGASKPPAAARPGQKRDEPLDFGSMAEARTKLNNAVAAGLAAPAAAIRVVELLQFAETFGLPVSAKLAKLDPPRVVAEILPAATLDYQKQVVAEIGKIAAGESEGGEDAEGEDENGDEGDADDGDESGDTIAKSAKPGAGKPVIDVDV